jgi:hypothetical protein
MKKVVEHEAAAFETSDCFYLCQTSNLGHPTPLTFEGKMKSAT